MKKVKLLLEPQEVEMIRDALEICYDEGDADDDEMLEGLCKAFGILTMSGNFVKVSVDERTEYIDDDTDPDAVDPDDCQCDECRADRGLPPLSGDCDGDPDNDGAPQVWDSTKIVGTLMTMTWTRMQWTRMMKVVGILVMILMMMTTTVLAVVVKIISVMMTTTVLDVGFPKKILKMLGMPTSPGTPTKNKSS